MAIAITFRENNKFFYGKIKTLGGNYNDSFRYCSDDYCGGLWSC